MSEADSEILVEIDGDGAALVTLNRPGRRNGWTPGLEPQFPSLPDGSRPERITRRRLPELDHDPGDVTGRER